MQETQEMREMKCNSMPNSYINILKEKKKEEEITGMRPSNLVDWTILPRRSVSAAMGLLHVLHDDRPDFAYSAFHGF